MSNQIIPSHKQVFYRSLVRWNIVDEIVFLTEPDEHQHSRRLILDTLDHAVLEAALAELSEDEHEAFLALCKDKFHEEDLLVWLAERVENIELKLSEAIQQTKQEIRAVLTEQMSLEDIA
jgi:hypothetical protein